MRLWTDPWDLAKLALVIGALTAFVFAPRSSDWFAVGVLALCSCFALSWAQKRFGPRSASPDKVVPLSVFLLGLVCVASRVLVALR